MPLRFAPSSAPDARTLAVQLGIGRTVLATAIMAAPVAAARGLGTDTATAQRVTWLTRMLAVRDGALGVGAWVAERGTDGRGAAGWLLAGAIADGVDAAVIAGALKQGRVRGLVPLGIVVGASASAAVGASTAIRLRRS